MMSVFQNQKQFFLIMLLSRLKIFQTFQYQKHGQTSIFVQLGRPCYQKNTEELIRVLYEINKIQQMHLVLLGVGHHADHLEEVKELIFKLNLVNNVTILNWTSREDVLNIINDSKLYLSTAQYEGLPFSIIESLALSIPCVVSNCDGNRDLIKNDFNGYIIDNNDTLAFCRKIIAVIK